ncbi:MAG: hypothetical protein ACXIVF_15305 [Rhizobiaceae bacterium]
MPDRDLATAETGRLWAADRVALADCRDRHGALVEAVETTEGQAR